MHLCTYIASLPSPPFPLRAHAHTHREYCQVLYIVSELEVLGIPTDLQAYLSYNKAVFIKGILKSHSHQPKVADHPASVAHIVESRVKSPCTLPTHCREGREREESQLENTLRHVHTHVACVFWYIQYSTVRMYKLQVRIYTYVRIGCLVISCCSQLLGAKHGVKAI